jgi:hypothetical protein
MEWKDSVIVGDRIHDRVDQFGCCLDLLSAVPINDARTFYYVRDHLYCEVDPYTEIKAAFGGWERCRPSAEALRAASRRAAAKAKSA